MKKWFYFIVFLLVIETISLAIFSISNSELKSKISEQNEYLNFKTEYILTADDALLTLDSIFDCHMDDGKYDELLDELWSTNYYLYIYKLDSMTLDNL